MPQITKVLLAKVAYFLDWEGRNLLPLEPLPSDLVEPDSHQGRLPTPVLSHSDPTVCNRCGPRLIVCCVPAMFSYVNANSDFNQREVAHLNSFIALLPNRTTKML